MQLWAQKTGRAERANLDDIEHVNWGNWLEEIILQKYGSERYANRKVNPSGLLIQSDDYPWMIATLDATTETEEWGEIPLDAKNTRSLMESAWEDGTPKKYYWQIQQQAVCMDAPAASIACLVGGNKLIWTDEVAVTAEQEQLLDVAERFWWFVKNDIPPDNIDALPETKRAIHATWPNVISGKKVDLSALQEADDILQNLTLDLKDARERVRKLDEIKAKQENRIRFAMKDAQVGQLASGAYYTLTNVQRKEYTVKPKPYKKLTRKK
jgi:predicted phage-related endonuclease